MRQVFAAALVLGGAVSCSAAMRQIQQVLGDQPRDGLTVDLGRELAARAARDQAAVQRLSEAHGRKARDAALLNKLAVFNANGRRAKELYERHGFPRHGEVGDRVSSTSG